MPKVVTQRCLELDWNPRPTDLIRCTTAPLAYLTFLNWPTFTSDVLIQFICVKPAAAWMAANSGMTAADVDKSVDAMKFCITDVGLCQSDLHRT